MNTSMHEEMQSKPEVDMLFPSEPFTVDNDFHRFSWSMTAQHDDTVVGDNWR